MKNIIEILTICRQKIPSLKVEIGRNPNVPSLSLPQKNILFWVFSSKDTNNYRKQPL